MPAGANDASTSLGAIGDQPLGFDPPVYRLRVLRAFLSAEGFFGSFAVGEHLLAAAALAQRVVERERARVAEHECARSLAPTGTSSWMFCGARVARAAASAKLAVIAWFCTIDSDRACVA